MNKRVMAFVVAANIMLPATVLAHEEPIEGQWCNNGNIVILGEFSFTSLHLARFERFAEDVCPGSGLEGGDIETKSCGQFDDEYDLARSATNHLCQSLAYRNVNSRGDGGTVRPIFYGPESLKNSDQNHHEVYSIVQGVRFACGLCDMEFDERERKLLIK
ncbi:hypothetical protein HWQ46_07295 [Shewanella sp. D64]|uniref:hypothetical protein n=1 Tax=unclassified Shewanella TaxID=196818 RepID=UPI0022BA644A|nr:MULTISPECIES: hypothetical protein [unclassified Shewanella]MEC4725349.1 hypothetical protein [Shewanella sp. D64]MEC4735805.1 hypothetical protein [Shewanella sp. E94]WBJ93224.1 hypothetical protein HWQ47_14795 [Shewanella sp. MTB7]